MHRVSGLTVSWPPNVRREQVTVFGSSSQHLEFAAYAAASLKLE
jgi:hypothetical protein